MGSQHLPWKSFDRGPSTMHQPRDPPPPPQGKPCSFRGWCTNCVCELFGNKNEELFRQTKPSKGRFVSRFAKKGYFCESGVFFSGKTRNLHKNLPHSRIAPILVNLPCFSSRSLPNDNKISDNKIRKMSKIYCHGISQEKKQRFWTIFRKISPPRPLPKRTFY